MAKCKNILIILLLSCSVQAAIIKPSLNSFNAGELSPLMEARSDFTKYNNGCRYLRNMFVLSQGPVTRRPGTKYIAETETMSERSELVPFEFSKTDAYMIEAGDLYMRFCRDGGQIIDADGAEDLSTPTDLTGNVVGHWKLNDDAYNTSVADTDGTHDGTSTVVTGSLTTTGYTNDCFDLVGLYAVDVTDHADFTFDDSADEALSIMAWVYVQPSNTTQIIISKYDLTGSSEAREWFLGLTSQEYLWFRMYDETTDYISDAFSENPLSEGWQFIVITYDGRGDSNANEGINIYINNILDTTYKFTISGYSQMRDTGANVIIGALENDSGNKALFWEDKLDNIAIFDKELTVSDVNGLWDTTEDEYELTTTYTEDEVSNLQYVQIADTMYIVHPDHEPRKLTRTGHTAWTIADVNYTDGPFIDENTTTTTITPSAITGTTTLTASSAIFEAGHVGSMWKIRHPRTDSAISGSLTAAGSSSAIACEGDYKFTTHGTWKGTMTLERTQDSGTTYETVYPLSSSDDDNVSYAGNEADSGYDYRVTMSNYTSGGASYDLIVYDHMHSGHVKILGYTSSTVVTGSIHVALGSVHSTAYWSEGYWSPKNGYPQTIEFHEFRLFYGGNYLYPQTIWASMSGDETDYESMKDGTDDDDALIYHLPGQNPIQFLHSDEVLVVGTLGGVGKLGDPDDAMTPTTEPSYRQQTPYGSDYIQAIAAGDAILYIDRGGSKVREFAYSLEKDRFIAPDMTILAEHITGDGIIDVAYQSRPDSVLWCVLDDGDMATMTYEKNNDVFAWSLQITEGDFESVAIIPGADEDEVWTIVNRTIDSNTVRYIEQIQSRDWGTDNTDCWFVDSGLDWDGGDAVDISGATKANPCVITVSTWPTEGDGTNIADGDQIKILAVVGMTELNGNIYTVDDADVSAKTFSLDNSAGTANINSTSYTTYSSGGTAQRFEKDFSNLDHVEGEELAVFADGEARTNITVSSGAIDTTSWYNKALAGLPYTSIMETMPIVFNTQSGSTSATDKNIINVAFDFYETLGISFGIDEDNLTTKDFDDMTTGWKEWSFPFGRMRSAAVYTQTSKPIPITIRQIIPEVEIYD